MFFKKPLRKKMITSMNILSKYAKDNGIQMVLEDFDDAPAYYKDAAGLKFSLLMWMDSNVHLIPVTFYIVKRILLKYCQSF